MNNETKKWTGNTSPVWYDRYIYGRILFLMKYFTNIYIAHGLFSFLIDYIQKIN